MKKTQCWEVKKCGREPDGKNADKLGVCKAALPNKYDNFNEGEHGGRFCWAITGTLCGAEVQGEYCEKIANCLSCEFLQLVEKEEGGRFVLTPQHANLILDMNGLKKKKA